jgi:hypothetical protein
MTDPVSDFENEDAPSTNAVERPVNGDSPEPDPVVIEELSQIVDDVNAAAAQHAEDVAWQTEHPNEPLIRQANPSVGGEHF